MKSAPFSMAAGSYALIPAEVTQTNDELGRVRVRLPWMEKADRMRKKAGQESDWIAVITPMAGKERGFFFMPEEKDEVLVAYAHSRFEPSYVVGFLWSKDAKPPAKERAKRQLRSVSGHVITLDDTKDAESISIVDKSGRNKIVLDAKNNTVTIESSGELKIHSQKGLSIQSDQEVSIQAPNVKIEAKQKLALEGATVALNGKGGIKLNDGALEVI